MLKAELNSPVYYTLECVIADIDRQPTAYDVDKVMEQIDGIMKDDSIRFVDQAVNVSKRVVKSGGIE